MGDKWRKYKDITESPSFFTDFSNLLDNNALFAPSGMDG